MRFSIPRAAFGLSLAAVFVSGCTFLVGTSQSDCANDTDCAAGEQCDDNVCVVATADESCADFCGQAREACSCRAECVDNGDCCADYSARCSDDDRDAGTGLTDAGQSARDGGQPPDAGTMGHDAGATSHDAGLVDAGVQAPDAGRRDGGVTSDAGSVSADAGTVYVDAGPGWNGIEPSVTLGVPDGVPDALDVPDGRVPLAIAAGNGRIVTSCDRGRTWVNDYVIAADATDHHDYSIKLAPVYGNGAMVIATGWGAPGHILRSEDGIDWEDISGEHFHWLDGTDTALTTSSGAIYFDGTRFILVSGRRVFYSTEGREWSEQDIDIAYSYFHWREMSYVPQLERVYLRGQSINPSAEWMVSSEDALATFTTVDSATGFVENCGGQVAVGHGLVMTSHRGGGDPNLPSSICVSSDSGATWTGHTADELPSVVFPTSAGWVGVRGWRNYLLTSPDGATWSEQSVAGYVGVTGARSPHGYYVLSSRQNDEFLYSDNGVDWTATDSPVDDDANRVRTFGFGHGAPSALCPLP